MLTTTLDLVDLVQRALRRALVDKTLDVETIVMLGINPTLIEVRDDGLVEQRTATLYTGAGTSIEFPESWGVVFSLESVLYGAARRPLPYEQRRRGAELPVGGEPVGWNLWGGDLELTPGAGAESTPVVVDAYCSGVLATPAAPATDELGAAPLVAYAIVYGATSKCAGILGDDKALQINEGLFKRWLKIVKKRRKPYRDQRSRRDRSRIDARYMRW
jgi:hypothetical protein